MNVEAIYLILPDIPRAFTALAEWIACVLCILIMKKRINGWKLAAVCASALVIQTAFLVLTDEQEGVLWLLCMAAAAGMMYLFLYICCDLNWKDVAYSCVNAFIEAEFAASLEWQLYCYFYESGWKSGWFKIICLIVVYGLVYWIIWAIGERIVKKEEGLRVTNHELRFYLVTGLAVFFVSNLGLASLDTPFSGQYMAESFKIRTFVDLGGLAILYAYHIQRNESRSRNELERVQSILHNQYLQYQQSQEAIDVINYKYHDLKHHIIALRAEEDSQKRNAYLDKMEAELQDYEAQSATGNKVLDTLITTKKLYCMKNHISLTCVIDGALVDFLDVMDICSIFGNALDNAIECELKIAEEEKRLIKVLAYSQRSFLIIRIENYYEGELEFDRNLPVTTKKETQFHGYGLKSLQYTVRKYGGEVDISTEHNWFVLKILIPMQE